MHPFILILFRWIHITTASIAVGGVFFIRVVFPIGLRALEAEPARAMLIRTRRVFKMVIHTCILLLLVSGTYNAIQNWPAYTAMAPPGVGHGLFGVHLLLALVAFAIAIWLLAGKEPRQNHLKWMGINLVVLLLTMAAASVLKYARENSTKSKESPIAAIHHGTATTQMTTGR